MQPEGSATPAQRVNSPLVPAQPTNPLNVPVFDLMHRPGEMREREIDAIATEPFGNAVIGVKKGGAIHVDARLESLHDGILVTATADAFAEGECIRCLDPIADTLRVDIAELFAYSFDEAFDHQVHDDRVDLEPVVRDAVVLSLPFQPVCQEDCLGLCPQCGVRLLDNPGHEHEAAVDPRWSALGGLRTELDGVELDATEEKR